MFPTQSEASIKKGTWFVIHDNSNTIHVWGSNTNGKEKVYLNEKLVSEKRNLGKKSEHSFEDDQGNNYHVLIYTDSYTRGSLVCEVSKNEELIKSFKTKFAIGKLFKSKAFYSLIIISALFGVIMGIFELPSYALFIFMACIFPLYIKMRSPGDISIIEDPEN
ncbi:hypothetical protein K6119_11405 [Paracrocinitomix mangrovi]|uniref:hypothetical protein n=1 Tax=Paracrocinitomix mangrovi TaxID=2862509 RepID=UPI001C8DE70A|nr:hypothetical protein [Paracrocinitomix mangrovi]UKN00341.1 hypothetical protein K6119_11405 [Paracrocinitomix mangrovi]